MKKLLICCALLVGCSSHPGPAVATPTSSGGQLATQVAWDSRTDLQKATICASVHSLGAGWAADQFIRGADYSATFDRSDLIEFFTAHC